MAIHFKIKATIALQPYLKSELDNYYVHLKRKEYNEAWHHLERAHVLGQQFAWPHTYVHWKMLMFGIRIKSLREIVGQIPRLVVGGVKSFVGKVPLGNTGGADVPPLRPMEIAPELIGIFRNCNIQYK